MDQLVDIGSRTVEGMAAMNGEMFRRMGEQNPGKGLLLPFETAYQNLKEVMEGLRAKPKANFNHEKSMTKLKDEFSAFKDLKGNPHDEEDDGVHFDPDEEEQPDKTAEPEVQSDEPEYEDMIDGPLPGRGLDAGPKYLGRPRFPWAAVWAPPAPLHLGLEGKSGFSNQYVDPKGHFTTVTRVVAATADGKPKVLLSYLLEALSPKVTRMREPWKSSDAREKMFLMKLRVFETPRQVAAFGWSTMQREVIPPDQDRDTYFPQYVPVREVQVHRIQERVCTVSRSQVLQTIAVLCMRPLGTLGVQLWDPGRAIVCIALPDLGSVEGCGGNGLSVRGE